MEKEKTYKLNIKSFLKQANWKHPDFGVVTSFFGNGDWIVKESDLEENKLKEENNRYYIIGEREKLLRDTYRKMDEKLLIEELLEAQETIEDMKNEIREKN